MPTQHPTCTGIRITSVHDAHVVFHAVSLGMLPMISRRLDTQERRAIASGCVFVWSERSGGPGMEAMGIGIERWTDSIRWGPSRVRDEFLFYNERDPDPIDIDLGFDSENASPLGCATHIPIRENLVKQTYSVFVETPHGRRKWHLIAYFTQDTLDSLMTVQDVPCLACIRVPPNLYKSARTVRPGARRGSNSDKDKNPSQSKGDYDCPWLSPTLPLQAILAPLEYLENVAPPPRHPEDEKALMSFVPNVPAFVLGASASSHSALGLRPVRFGI